MLSLHTTIPSLLLSLELVNYKALLVRRHCLVTAHYLHLLLFLLPMSTALQLVNDNKRRRIEAWLEAIEWAKSFVPRLNGTPQHLHLHAKLTVAAQDRNFLQLFVFLSKPQIRILLRTHNSLRAQRRCD